MIKPKLLRHIRNGVKLLAEGNEYTCKQRGITKVGLFNKELPMRYFTKSPLTLVTAAEYYKDPEAARAKIKDALDLLVEEGYLTIRQHTESSFYYKPTLKVTSNDNDESAE
ncbi:TPA: hypothetical protein MCT59_003799 [Klebsiella pneumoniae]|nr:hypothetical protein [Klebsiella pneumoniae]